jgi:hypothetical protein
MVPRTMASFLPMSKLVHYAVQLPLKAASSCTWPRRGPVCNCIRIMTGVRFLFRVTLRRLDLAAEIYHLREPQKIPQVISPDEARRLLAVASSLRNDTYRGSGMAWAASASVPTPSEGGSLAVHVGPTEHALASVRTSAMLVVAE